MRHYCVGLIEAHICNLSSVSSLICASISIVCVVDVFCWLSIFIFSKLFIDCPLQHNELVAINKLHIVTFYRRYSG